MNSWLPTFDYGDTALLLGAGFSHWAAGLPLAQDLFDFNIHTFGVREARRLERVQQAMELWKTSEIDGDVEDFIYFAALQSDKMYQDICWYVGRRLSEPFVFDEPWGGRRSLHISSFIYHYVSNPFISRANHGINRARLCLERWIDLTSFTGIITTNYDLLVEYALGAHKFHYGVDFEELSGGSKKVNWRWWRPKALQVGGFMSIPQAIPLAKVHGSLSWDQANRYVDGRRGVTGGALIIPPARVKQMIQGLEAQWSLAEGILANARRLVAFGFAFNKYDNAFNDLLLQSGRRIESVNLVDPFPPLQQAQALFPRAQVTVTDPPNIVEKPVRGYQDAIEMRIIGCEWREPRIHYDDRGSVQLMLSF